MTSSCKFLDGMTDLTGERTAMQSFVRSGNTFLRRYLEQVTGVFTGADMHISHTFFESMMGLLGQYITSESNRVWVTKTHWPLESPTGAEKFGTQRCFSVVRNPIDTLVSLSYLTSTSSHSMITTVPLCEADPDWWKVFIKASSISINDCTRCMR